jgi:hypothetical protein
MAEHAQLPVLMALAPVKNKPAGMLGGDRSRVYFVNNLAVWRSDFLAI